MRDHPRRDPAEHDGNTRSFQRHRDDREAAEERSSDSEHSPPLRALKDVADGLGVPASATRRGHTSRIERLGNLPQRRRTSFLRLSNDGEHIGRVSVSFGHDRHLCVPAGHVELWAT
jgi:hypothetical protein